MVSGNFSCKMIGKFTYLWYNFKTIFIRCSDIYIYYIYIYYIYIICIFIYGNIMVLKLNLMAGLLQRKVSQFKFHIWPLDITLYNLSLKSMVINSNNFPTIWFYFNLNNNPSWKIYNSFLNWFFLDWSEQVLSDSNRLDEAKDALHFLLPY